VTTTERSTPYRSAASRCVACPVTIDIHNSYFSPGDSRRRAFRPDTGEADIINSLQIGRTRRSVAGYYSAQYSDLVAQDEELDVFGRRCASE
jgi:hypothetical protein